MTTIRVGAIVLLAVALAAPGAGCSSDAGGGGAVDGGGG